MEKFISVPGKNHLSLGDYFICALIYLDYSSSGTISVNHMGPATSVRQ